MDLKRVLITFAPLLIWNALCVVSMIYYFILAKERVIDRDLNERTNTKLLTIHLKQWWVWYTSPIVRLCVKFKITPNMVTTAGMLLCVAAAIFFAFGYVSSAGWAMIFGGACDLYDGKVARALNMESKSGHFYDGMLDRIGESFLFIGLIYYYRESWIALAAAFALIGAQLVSYARARGENLGVDCEVGLMQRPERVVYLGVGSIFGPMIAMLFSRWIVLPIDLITTIAIVFIAVMTWVTTIHRMCYIMKHLKRSPGL